MKNNNSLYQELNNEIQALKKALLFLLKRELVADIGRKKVAWSVPWLNHRIKKTKEKLLLLGYDADAQDGT